MSEEAKGTRSTSDITQDGGNFTLHFTRSIDRTRGMDYLPCILRKSGRRSGTRTPCRRKPCRGPDRCRRTLENEGEMRTRLLTGIYVINAFLNISSPLSLKKPTCMHYVGLLLTNLVLCILVLTDPLMVASSFIDWRALIVRGGV